MKSIILASTSEYRQAVLKKLGLPFLAAAPNIDESAILQESAEALVTKLSYEKANALTTQYNHHLIIGSDQVCVIEKKIIGKPHTFENAFNQLKAASGSKVTFYTGLCLLEIAKVENLICNVNCLMSIFVNSVMKR